MRIKSITNICNRPENQDNYWCAILKVNSLRLGVVCVCDGMGGLENGGKASTLLVSRVREHFLLNGTIEGIEDVVDEANVEIKSMSETRSGTTCTVLMCADGNYYIYNVGDTRCYIWSREGVTQLTTDHTVIQKYKNEGREITPEIEKRYKNVLTSCVGVMDSVKYDIFTGSYTDKDRFLVCSDGFWHTLGDNDFLSGEILDLDNMVNRCIDLGESDNITACILDMTG